MSARFAEGLALHKKGALADAQAAYHEVLAVQPDHFDALHLLGVIGYQAGNFPFAVELIAKAIAIHGTNSIFHSNLGLALKALKRFDEALTSFDRAIDIDPGRAQAFNDRGSVLLELKRAREALASYERAIGLKPDFAEAIYNRGVAYQELERQEEALASYDLAIGLKPDYAEAFNNRGNALQKLGRTEEALASYDRALILSPGHAETFNNRGSLLQTLGRQQDALASFDRAISIRPAYAQAFYNRGGVLFEMRRIDEAKISYDQALAIAPHYAECFNNRGNVLLELKRLSEALADYDRALSINPNYADALNNRGHTLRQLGRNEDALASYERAKELKPDQGYVYGEILHAKMLACSWAGLEENIAELLERVENGDKVATPFIVTTLTSDLPVIRRAAEIWANDKCPARALMPDTALLAPKGKIRVGYFSADFRNHATSFLAAELFELHDRGKFEVYGFSYGPDTKDEMRHRLEVAFDEFLDIRNQSDLQSASTARELEVEIAVDLNSHTKGGRPGIFAHRAAPIQVSYLAYPLTMGAEYMDYLVADPTVVPEASHKHYAEAIAKLPHTYQVNDRKRAISDQAFTREEAGLPPTGFVFCCFNNSYKITPRTFDGWMRLLKQVDGSVLWLLEGNPMTARNLCKEAEARGVDRRRLVFARRMPLSEHLARHRLADLFIDTLPCNAHTTASDALWAGLPVLTCTGDSFASRVAASLLTAIGLPELITHTPGEYEALAIELATMPEKLNKIRDQLRSNRLSAPLFDTPLFCRHIENAYLQMSDRYRNGLKPDAIRVT